MTLPKNQGASSSDQERVLRLDLDSGKMTNRRQTPQGGLVVDANLARIGVQTYRMPDGTTRRELRHPDEVFHPDALASFAHAPVTLDHPGRVTPDNYRKVSVGHVAGAPQRNGKFMSGTIYLQDAQAIKDAEAHDAQEVSCGYECRVDMTPGEWNGEKYDGQQKDIRGNHVAIGPKGWGRAGPEVRLHMDGGGVSIVEDETHAHFAGEFGDHERAHALAKEALKTSAKRELFGGFAALGSHSVLGTPPSAERVARTSRDAERETMRASVYPSPQAERRAAEAHVGASHEAHRVGHDDLAKQHEKQAEAHGYTLHGKTMEAGAAGDRARASDDPEVHKAAEAAHLAAAEVHEKAGDPSLASAHQSAALSFSRSAANLSRLKKDSLLQDDWDDSKHPRGEGGKFGEGSGEGKAKAEKSEGKKPIEGKRTWTDKLPEGMKPETWQSHYDKHPEQGGKPTAERKASVHDPIVKAALDVKPPAPGEQKLAIMTMGAPASGKSSALRDIDTSKYVKVDPDAIKEKLPEYQKAISDKDNTYRGAAVMAHEESSAIAKDIMRQAMANGNHIVVDGTGANEKSFLSKMKQLQDAGYKVHVAMPHLEKEEGIARMKDRAEKSGRMVPEKFAREAYDSIPRNFESIARQADSFALHDNAGKEPRKVWEGGKGKSDTLHDPAFVAKFRATHRKDSLDTQAKRDAVIARYLRQDKRPMRRSMIAEYMQHRRPVGERLNVLSEYMSSRPPRR